MKKFDPQIADAIVTYIQAGAYDHVAAEAAGLSKEDYHAWIERGTRKHAGKNFRKFAERIRQAKALARVWAEIEMRKEDARFWLKSGPGKESPHNPGWSKEVRPIIFEDARTINVLATPEWNSLWAIILAALANFPEARQALALALTQSQPQLPKPQVIDVTPDAPTTTPG